MPRATSPYIVGDFWLDKRRDGKAPDTWQIASAVKRSVVYRSTHSKCLVSAKSTLDAFVAEQKAAGRQEPDNAELLPLLMFYWRERGSNLVNSDQTERSLRTFIGFLSQDKVGARAVIVDLVPTLFERFREWRMHAHGFAVPWAGKTITYTSSGVSGATVQRNINDIRAAVNHAVGNMRIPFAPKICDLDKRYNSPPRERVLSMEELARIAWYASHNLALLRFVALQFGTAVRPQAALQFDPVLQYDPGTGLIDLQPLNSPQTKKRNAIVPAIRPLRVLLQQWQQDPAAGCAASHKTAWRIMRRTLGLSSDVYPKTIRHTVATLLYSDESVPEREIVELLGHEGQLARTTRIYAKYDPTRLRNTSRVLTKLWWQVRRSAQSYAADHLLTTTGQGGKLIVVEIDQEGEFLAAGNGGRGRD